MASESINLQGKPFGFLVVEYIDFIKNIKARSTNTTNAYSQDLNCFLSYLASSEINGSVLSTESVTSYLKHLRLNRQLKPATVRRRLITLQGFCHWLVGRGLDKSPFDELTLDLRVPKRLPRPVDPLTVRQLVVEFTPQEFGITDGQQSTNFSSRTSQRQTTQLVIQLMLVTGIRVGEVAGIRIKDMSSDASTIHILGKGDKERLVYIENSRLAEALSSYRKNRERCGVTESTLFINCRARPLTPQVIRKRIKSMCADIGTGDTPTPHRFRHSAATLLIEGGVDMRVVQRLLGHASISTTELYTQVTDVSLRDALRKADVLSQFQ